MHLHACISLSLSLSLLSKTRCLICRRKNLVVERVQHLPQVVFRREWKTLRWESLVSATPPTKIIATVQSDLRGYIYGVQLVMCPFICMYISCRHWGGLHRIERQLGRAGLGRRWASHYMGLYITCTSTAYITAYIYRETIHCTIM